MTGRRAAPRARRNLDELVRLACSTDPLEPERRPRRLALAPRAAMLLGAALLVLAVLLALRTALTAPSATSQEPSPAGASIAGTPSPATGTAPPGVLTPTDPREPGASETPTPGTQVVVHVAGAVREPGVVVLAVGDRVDDAIDAAGGLLEDADPDQLNLARVLADGEQVRVPHLGEDASSWGQTGTGAQAGSGTAASGGSGSAGTGTGGVATSASGELIDVNTANAAALEALPGIGPALAERIVTYRDEHGPFASVDALTDVPGIGDGKLEALRDSATVGAGP